ncbi:four helix bundle protein [Allofrancisella inopinata]|uniref:Four helix bundle protein n=1 Tax=Allofrancisella inopinata TaxID=1085647 RepID=A0AAE6YGQ8_9GAMM|nr:four helix bundle protein [Allofrancisella inopinata]QIV95578.1 four helix bundle protein [Allofrancisella inopinata]TDT70733.1 four helix bundle protein [Allofrancisella inopinata]
MKCEKLEVWEKSINICTEIYKLMGELRDYSFRDQITRSALSIPSNIAEGIERISDKEKVRFLDIARGSLAELQTQIIVGTEINYINKEKSSQLINQLDQIGKMLTGLIKSIKGITND